MEIKTKYDLHARLWSIRGNKACVFDVGYIGYDSKTNEIYYGPVNYDTYPESMCFPSSEELIAYILDIPEK